MSQAHRRFKKGQREPAQRLRKPAQRLPADDTSDPDYRRLRYGRYTDACCLGCTGPKAAAEKIKQHRKTFLREERPLERSASKTLITQARSEAAKFLGYEITILQKDTKRPKNKAFGTKRRSITAKGGLRVPRTVVRDQCTRAIPPHKVMHRPAVLNESDDTIVATYQLEMRGIANYYRRAYHLHTLPRLKGVMEQSLTKTLATKHHTSVQNIMDKYQAEWIVEGPTYKGLRVPVPREGKPPLVATWGGIPLTWDIQADLEDRPQPHWTPRAALEKRLLAHVCEHCGAPALTEQIEVHHIRARKDLNRYTGQEQPLWVKSRAARRRKTVVVCRTCHRDIQHGRPVRRRQSRS